MSGFFPDASAGAPTNATDTYEPLGFGASDAGTTVTAHATAHTKGTYASLGTSAAAWSGHWVLISGAALATNRFLVDVSTGASPTVIDPSLYAQPGQGTSGSVVPYWVPIPTAAGTVFQARSQASVGSAVCAVAIVGVLAGSTSRPGFTTMTALNIDTANTRPSASNVPMTGSWVTVIDPTVATYGAIILAAGSNGTQPATTQNAGIYLGTGAAASEVEAFRSMIYVVAGNPNVKAGAPTIYNNSIPSGTRLSVKCVAATAGSDNIRVAAYGFA